MSGKVQMSWFVIYLVVKQPTRLRIMPVYLLKWQSDGGKESL